MKTSRKRRMRGSKREDESLLGKEKEKREEIQRQVVPQKIL